MPFSVTLLVAHVFKIFKITRSYFCSRIAIARAFSHRSLGLNTGFTVSSQARRSLLLPRNVGLGLARLPCLHDHDEAVHAGEEHEEDGEEDEADEVEARHHLALPHHLDGRVAAAPAAAPAAAAVGRADSVDGDVVGALLDAVDLEAEQDDRVLEEGAEHEEDARYDPSLEGDKNV